MFKRYPYTIALLTVISFVVCIVWLFTHEACMHPLGNGLAAWWVILGYALLEHFILIGTLRETKAKPGALVYQSLRLVILCALVLTI